VLFEAATELGGQGRIAAQSRVRKDLIGITDWLAAEVERLGVDIRFNTYAGDDDVLAEAPDAVIIASGGLPDVEHFPGGELCLSVWDILGGQKVEGSVLIYDDNGQHQAPSLACELAARGGAEIALVTPDRGACIEMGASNYPMYLSQFHKGGVKVTPDHRIARVERDGNALVAHFSNDYGGPALSMRADHVVVEHGTVPLDEVYDGLRRGAGNGGVTDLGALIAGQTQPVPDEGYALYRIGDAVASRNIHAAIYDARRLCLTL
jgi:pyruvate/2-oxoglutarate dehydrogenase complex dihydrolipoamide dehydrogenase (E3) component